MTDLALCHEHPWNVSPAEAVLIQQTLRPLVVREGDMGAVRTLVALDVGLHGERARAAVAAYAYPSLAPLEEAVAEREVAFPYVPGLLTFREGPVAIAALSQLRAPWDLLLCDGQGIAHPRRMGLASHLGVLLGKPSVGCAKSRLIGSYDEPALERGSWQPLVDNGEIVGAALRTRTGVKPVFVSIGHCVDLANAIEVVLACTRGRRLPEPARRAHALASG